MRQLGRLLTAAAVAGLALATAPAAVASADQQQDQGAHRVVFVQTNNPAGNQIIAYDRAGDGRLTPDRRYNTGGRGAVAAGAVVDPLASQNSLVYDGEHALLFAANAGSNSLSAFAVDGDRLRLRQVVSSGDPFPVSVAVHDQLVYVLNAAGAGSVHGYRIDSGRLQPIEGSSRTLGLKNTNPPNFLMSPGQVGFTPDGDKLIVTTKASGNHIDVFAVRPDGRLSNAPVVNPSATPVPFAFTFDLAGRLVASEAGTSSVTTYIVNADGSLTTDASLSDGQAAGCWIHAARGTYYVANTGSANLSGFHVDAQGHVSLVGTTGIVAATAGGPIDMAVAAGGRFLYLETAAAGTVYEFHVNADGTLTQIGTIAGETGLEGIVAA
ncbi:MAG TPA: hypothetical protein VLL25_09345 [Acidimicrobiales bacterium]|nr:hypothetical protein [Acidimicrobiales bacterium]